MDVAAAWHSRWRNSSSSHVSADVLEQWKAWREDAANRDSYDAVDFVYGSRSYLTPPPLPTAEELAADESDPDIVIHSSWSPRVAPKRMRRWRPMLVAAAAVLSTLAIAPAIFRHPSHAASSVFLFDTGAKEKRRYTLQDGSEITLGNQTHLSVHYGRCDRTILLESGEAFFKVAHQPSCPFVVIAGHGQVTAIGTAFAVNRTLDRITVSVAEGAVDVRPRDESVSVQDIERPARSSEWTRVTLEQGQGVSFNSTQLRGPVESEDPAVATAWIKGRREYRHEPLAYVVADINRYFGKQIVLDDSATAQLQFTGRVYESQVMDWVNALPAIFPVAVSQTDSDHILIRSRHPKS